MPSRLLLALAVLAWLATDGHARGVDAREGEGFLSASGTVEGPDEFGLYRQSFSLYAEYGAPSG